MYNKESCKYEGFIYCIANDLNKKKYIGQTTTTVSERFSQHKSNAKHFSTRGKYRGVFTTALYELGVEHFYYREVEKISADTNEELMDLLNEAEIFYIDLFNSIYPYGYNCSPGGDNNSIRIRNAVVAYNAAGEKQFEFDSLIDAARYVGACNANSIIKVCRGKGQSASGYIWRYSSDSFDKYPVTISQEDLDKPHLKNVPIDQYDLRGNKIASYPSIISAAKAINKNNCTSEIVDCCCGRLCSSHHFVWRYSGEPFGKYETAQSYYFIRKVSMYSTSGSFICYFDNICDASKYLRKNYHNAERYLLKVIRNDKYGHGAYGYKWYFADDPNQPDSSKIIA